MTNNDDRNHVGSCWSSSPITYNSKWSIRTPRVLIKKEVRHSNVCKTKVAPNYILSCVEPTQNSWSSPSITYNSKVSIRTPRVLTFKEARYKNFCKTKVALNYIKSSVAEPSNQLLKQKFLLFVVYFKVFPSRMQGVIETMSKQWHGHPTQCLSSKYNSYRLKII